MKELRTYSLFLLLFLSCFSSFGQIRTRRHSNEYATGYYQRMTAGAYHAAEIRNGKLYTWGRNDHGQLGDGTTIHRSVPVQVGTDEDWVGVAAGISSTLGMKSDGTIWAWGSDEYGQVGDGPMNTADVLAPKKIVLHYAEIHLQGHHGLLIVSATGGKVYAFGLNSSGQLGYGSPFNRDTPTASGTHNTDWLSLSTGYYHTLAVHVDGSLWAWGENAHGEAGTGNRINQVTPLQIGTDHNWISVHAGYQTSFALRADGTLWAWGRNDEGQLGDGTTTDQLVPVQITNDHDWLSVDADSAYTMALKANGQLYAWGSNQYGQFGNGTTNSSHTPLAIAGMDNCVSISTGNAYSLVLKANGKLFASGDNAFGQLANGTHTSRHSFLQCSGDLSEWLSIQSGSFHTLGLKTDGSLWAWGDNDQGQLGNGTFTKSNVPSRVGVENNWKAVSAKGEFSLALKADGTLWAWGSNEFSQLGNNATANRSVPIQIGADTDWTDIAAGQYHGIALKSDGTLWFWGGGETSTDDLVVQPVPVQIGTANDWRHVGASSYSSLVIKSNGTLWTFTTATEAPVQIGSDSDWLDATGGGFHSMAMKSSGYLWSWGDNSFGQLAVHDNVNRTAPTLTANRAATYMVCGYWHSLKSDVDGIVYTCGSNETGQLGTGETGVGTSKNEFTEVTVSQIPVGFSAGNFHTELITSASRANYCGSGWNSKGQLGDGSYADKNSFDCLINMFPHFDPVQDLVLCSSNKDSVSITGITAGAGEAQDLVLNATVINSSFLTITGLDYSSPESSATIHYASSADAAGTVQIVLELNDQQATNNVYSDTFTVAVNHCPSPDEELFIPNLVTVNDDGHNDTFIIQGLPPYSYVGLYNRWGAQVFESDDYQNDWTAEEGLYFYKVRTGGASKEYNGWVHVIK